MLKILRTNIIIFVISTILKILLIPSYHSSDYEVHRNWLAITAELRPSQWYYDTTSPWTLDYPPLFAWFERLMVPASRLADPLMSRLSSINYLTTRSFIFMRGSVCTADCLLSLGNLLILSSEAKGRTPIVSSLLVLLNAGFLLVDHIHFQFNGFLLGVLLLSMGSLRRASTSPTQSGEVLWSFNGGALFAALLVLKHLFLPLAPVFFVHLLLGFCFRGHKFSVGRFIALGAIVLGVMGFPFVPIILDHKEAHGGSLAGAAHKQLLQIGTRLFPFVAGADGSVECVNSDRHGVFVNACHERGLVHAYWAANVWALYLFADRVMAQAAKRFPTLRFLLEAVREYDNEASPSSGLVSRINTAVLPNVSPSVAAAATLAAISPALLATGVEAIRSHARAAVALSTKARGAPPPHDQSDGKHSANSVFERSLAHAALSAFMFGWHVHEKAILVPLVPLAVVVASNTSNHQDLESPLFLRLCGFGLYALFPLFTHPRETPTKILLYLCFMRVSWLLIKPSTPRPPAGCSTPLSFGGLVDKAFMFSLAATFLFSEVLHPLLLRPWGVLEFLPLMLTSVVCAAGIFLCWCDSALRLLKDLPSSGNIQK